MIEFTDTAIPVSLILKIKESKLSVYGERKDVTPPANDLACWLFLFFIVTACFFQLRICLWEMFIDFDASHREKPLSTFQQITCKYMSFSCSVNCFLFLVTPLHPSSCSCSSCSSSFTTCMSSCSCSSSFTACMLSCSSCSSCSLFAAHMSSCSFSSFTTHMFSCSCSSLSLSSSPMITASMSSCCCCCSLCSSSTTDS